MEWSCERGNLASFGLAKVKYYSYTANVPGISTFLESSDKGGSKVPDVSLI